MQLSKIAVLLLAGSLAFASPESPAAVKKTVAVTAKKQTLSQAKKPSVKPKTVAKKKTAAPQNHTKKYYGVKGAKLSPTTVSNNTYAYREKGKGYQTIGKEASRQYGQVGVASYYGGMFNGRKTANGEVFNENSYTAAHKTLALGSYALVTNLRNGRKVIVKINDRGPFSKARILDLSKGAAREIGMIHSGVTRVKVEAMHVDSQGYISGKGAAALYQLAKRTGLPLKVKSAGGDLAFKADESPKPAVENARSAEKTTTQPQKQAVRPNGKNAKTVNETTARKTVEKPKPMVPKGPKVEVYTKTEKEAKRLALQVKQKAVVEKGKDGYRVVIAVADKNESSQVQKQVKKLAHYQSMQFAKK